MCKSASSVFCWYAEQLVYNTYPACGREKLRELTASKELKGLGRFVDYPVTDEKLRRLLDVVDDYGPTVVKVHWFLTPYLQELIENGRVYSTFCYRDPRDMILSAMDHRVRAVADGVDVFSNFTDVESAMTEAMFWCRLSCSWVDSSLVPLFKYTDIVTSPAKQIRKLANYLEIDFPDTAIDAMLENDQRHRKVGRNEFNQGKLDRYQHEMTSDEIALCNARLGLWIQRLGFPVEVSKKSAPSFNAA